MTSGPVMNMWLVPSTIRDEVRDRRRIDRPRPRAHYQGELRHDAAEECVAQEDIRIAAEALDPLLNSRSTGVVEANDRAADALGQIHRFDDLWACIAASDPPKTVKS